MKTATHRGKDLDDGGNQEPNQTLKWGAGILADREHHGQQKPRIAHLFPQEMSQTGRAALTEA